MAWLVVDCGRGSYWSWGRTRGRYAFHRKHTIPITAIPANRARLLG
jgi:hypothetical protein